MAKAKPFIPGPGQSDMTMAEALELVIGMASCAARKASPEPFTKREQEAIERVRALAVGSYNLKPQGARG